MSKLSTKDGSERYEACFDDTGGCTGFDGDEEAG